MKGFDPKYKNFPDYILKITKQIWENKDKVLGQLVEIRADAATQSQDAEDTWSLRFPRFKTFRGFDIGEKI